jgi:2-methylfumaryl-CoA hydratase
VIGLKANSSGRDGVVWVRTRGLNQHDDCVLDYVRWVMIRKRDPAAPAPPGAPPDLAPALEADMLGDACPPIDAEAWDAGLAGAPCRWGDFVVGERIDHVDGVTVEEAEHQLATRLYQNAAKVHFNQLAQGRTPAGRRLIYGGHVISLARALSFNGLGCAFHVAGVNAGRHVAPLHAGSTVFAWSEILAVEPIPGRDDVGALRIRTVATKDRSCEDFPDRVDGGYDPAVILDLDYWALAPR